MSYLGQERGAFGGVDDRSFQNGVQPEFLVECPCCCTDVHFQEMVQCYESHLCCSQCLERYAQEVVFGYAQGELRCLTEDCQSTFPRSELWRALPGELYSKYEARVAQDNIDTAGLENFIKCISCDYGAILDSEIEYFSCPQCSKEFCRLCYELYEVHKGLTCEQVEKDEEIKIRTTYEEIMAETKIRTCWKCKTGYTKERDTCNKITCRCQATMCYICRAPDIDYSHFCRHPRDPGEGCTSCDACSLWFNADEDDQLVIQELQKEADQTREHERLKRDSENKQSSVVKELLVKIVQRGITQEDSVYVLNTSGWEHIKPRPRKNRHQLVSSMFPELDPEMIQGIDQFLKKGGVGNQTLRHRNSRKFVRDFILDNNVLDRLIGPEAQQAPPIPPKRGGAAPPHTEHRPIDTQLDQAPQLPPKLGRTRQMAAPLQFANEPILPEGMSGFVPPKDDLPVRVPRNVEPPVPLQETTCIQQEPAVQIELNKLIDGDQIGPTFKNEIQQAFQKRQKKKYELLQTFQNGQLQHFEDGQSQARQDEQDEIAPPDEEEQTDYEEEPNPITSQDAQEPSASTDEQEAIVNTHGTMPLFDHGSQRPDKDPDTPVQPIKSVVEEMASSSNSNFIRSSSIKGSTSKFEAPIRQANNTSRQPTRTNSLQGPNNLPSSPRFERSKSLRFNAPAFQGLDQPPCRSNMNPNVEQYDSKALAPAEIVQAPPPINQSTNQVPQAPPRLKKTANQMSDAPPPSEQPTKHAPPPRRRVKKQAPLPPHSIAHHVNKTIDSPPPVKQLAEQVPQAPPPISHTLEAPPSMYNTLEAPPPMYTTLEAPPPTENTTNNTAEVPHSVKQLTNNMPEAPPPMAQSANHKVPRHTLSIDEDVLQQETIEPDATRFVRKGSLKQKALAFESLIRRAAAKDGRAPPPNQQTLTGASNATDETESPTSPPFQRSNALRLQTLELAQRITLYTPEDRPSVRPKIQKPPLPYTH